MHVGEVAIFDFSLFVSIMMKDCTGGFFFPFLICFFFFILDDDKEMLENWNDLILQGIFFS